MKRILVRAPNWIGDQVLAYPFYRMLRAHYPDAWIAVICTEWVKDIQFRGFVDEVLVLPRKKTDSFLKTAIGLFRYSKSIKAKGPWDLGISLPNSFGAALILKLAGAKKRRGYVADARTLLLNEPMAFDPSASIHRAQAYLNLLAREGLPAFEGQDYWQASGEAEFDPYRHWPEIEPIEPPHEPYFVIAPGSNADSRRWATEQFAEFIERMSARHPMKCVVVGGRAEKEIAAHLFRERISVEDYTGRGWVAAHWKLFKNANFTLSNDSGLAHVASLCGSKVQVVWGAGDLRRTQPTGPGPVQVKINPVDCWPCEWNQCKFQGVRKNQCLNGIHPITILEEVENGFFTS
jgi:heptosyltransferase-2